MSIEKYMEQQNLDKYSFLWSEARLVIGAVALFMGGVPPVYALLPFVGSYGIVGKFLGLAWIISGVAAGYLFYRWYTGGQKLFGAKNQNDMGAFLVMVVTGFNLGFAGLFGKNIGFSISSNYNLLVVVGLLYLATAWYLYQRWNGHGQKLF